jgi:hypothetical protein
MSETIQQLKEDIALLQMKLQKLEETQMTLEKSGEFSIVSYNGETYYRNLYDGICGGWYKTDTDGEVFYLVEDETERKLEKLYQEQVVVKEPEKEQKWDVVRESVKWCKENPEKSVEDYLKPQGPQGPVGPGPGPKGVIVGYEPTPQEPEEKEQKWDVEKLQEKNWYVDAKDLIESETSPPEPTSTVFRQKLFDGIKSVFYDPDYERTHWKMKVDMAVDEVLTHFYDILPEPEEYIGDYGPSQGYVDGWNHYHEIIKEKLE